MPKIAQKRQKKIKCEKRKTNHSCETLAHASRPLRPSFSISGSELSYMNGFLMPFSGLSYFPGTVTHHQTPDMVEGKGQVYWIFMLLTISMVKFESTKFHTVLLIFFWLCQVAQILKDHLLSNYRSLTLFSRNKQAIIKELNQVLKRSSNRSSNRSLNVVQMNK